MSEKIRRVLSSRLRILGRWVTATYHKQVEMPDMWGDVQPNEGAIRIVSDGNMNVESTQQVLIHEILHIYDDQLAIKLEHHQLDVLAFAIMDMIKHNPALVTFIRKSGK